ncbi:type II toxin-antitoxin system RelE/ParE family toxin [Parapusillimonas sp. SGNA-6]|uniref:type II toxin-antitoxin system RelE/ParE family toxin n=1 Tax=Parapedobacter sp. SGR-10 TaxID=2710879 RepID=UPI0013D18120|nr:type II toxin-antitoxin system RelE/ParE family toxin [Parapedobacter sp. SGR-10]NGF54902.1 type II toxin-antitoxin system RelE/ParE family toxin [Parapedobacter sp. SGR-10]NGM89729.1 type II toxin-antitoxin system RelE/ParE family toxin [Parapusillimonas sp. SGNA-6]
MEYTVVYHNDTEEDIRKAKKWYKEQLQGLEKRFALSVKETIKYIIDNPLLFEVKYKETRIAFTKVFPFGVHYHFNQHTKTITIVAILHTSINPQKWVRRRL